MNKTVIAGLLGIALIFAGQAEAGKKYSFKIEDRSLVDKHMPMDGVEALVDMVRYFGYKCDSVSALIKIRGKTGFNLRCNKFKYKYDIIDRGGRWTVKYVE